MPELRFDSTDPHLQTQEPARLLLFADPFRAGWAKSRSFFHMLRSPLPNPDKWNALVHRELVLLSRRRSPQSVLNQEARTPFADRTAAYNMISESSALRVMTPPRLFLRQSSSHAAWSLRPSVQFFIPSQLKHTIFKCFFFLWSTDCWSNRYRLSTPYFHI